MKTTKQYMEEHYGYFVSYDHREGYEIIGKKACFSYHLLELKTLQGNTYADIVCIMLSFKQEGYVGMLNYYYGASNEDVVDVAFNYIESFENGEMKPLEIEAHYIPQIQEYLKEHNLDNIIKLN